MPPSRNQPDFAACLLECQSEDCTPFMQSESTTELWNFDSFVEWLYLNRVRVGIGLAVVVLVIAGVAFFNWKKNQNELEANAALFTLPSPIAPAGKTSQARSEDFQKLAAEYPDTQAAERAELIAAGISFTDGKYADSQREFSKFLEKHDGSSLQAQAAIGVAASLEAQGKINEAVTKYQELISKYSGENVIPPAKLTLARLLETQNKPADALKLYDDLARSNNPYDPWAGEAGERREQLLQKFPNLKPKPAVTSSSIPPASAILAPQSPSASTNPIQPK